jgi:hypothetical protein
MKKLILSIAILAVMTFAACSEEEKDYTPNYVQCQHCDIPEEEGYEVCRDINNNAFVGNADTGIQLERYFELFCDNEPLPPPTGGGGQPVYTNCIMCISDEHPDGVKTCKGSNGNAFTFVGNTGTDTEIPYAEYLTAHCISTEPIPVTFTDCVTCQGIGGPLGELCKGSDGNAYLDEVDLGTTYSQYLNIIEMAGGSCD